MPQRHCCENPSEATGSGGEPQEVVQAVVCLLIVGAFVMVYIGQVQPVVARIQAEKSGAWRDRWSDVDGRVKRLMFFISTVFISWSLIFFAYHSIDGESGTRWYAIVDVLVWINGSAFLLTWFSMRGRFVDHEQLKAIDSVLDLMAEADESDEEIVYDIFTPWEYKGEALLTNTGVKAAQVKAELEHERGALEARTRGGASRQKSALVAAENNNTLSILILSVLMIAVPALLFLVRFFSHSSSLSMEIGSSFYVACVVAGTGIGLIATRLASVYLDLSALTIASIVLYAALQPAFVFKDMFEHYIPEWMAQEVAIAAADSHGLGAASDTSNHSEPTRAALANLPKDEAFLNLKAALFLYSLFGKVVIGAVFLKLLAAGRLHYYMYYLQRSRALLHVHRRLTTANFPGTRPARRKR